jgi:outer membrane protein OmpA-like peptidoglycan-associated protein
MFRSVLAAAIIFAAGGAHAEDKSSVRSIGSLSYQYSFADRERPTADGRGVHVGLGMLPTERILLEAAVDLSRFGEAAGIGRSGRSYGIKLGGAYVLMPSRLFNPYIGMGAGMVVNELREPNDRRSRAFGEATLGVMSGFLGLRTELAYRITDGLPGHPSGTTVSPGGELMLRAGVVIPLSRSRPPPSDPAPASPGEAGTDERVESAVPAAPASKPQPSADVSVQPSEIRIADLHFGFDRDDPEPSAHPVLAAAAADILMRTRIDGTLRVHVEGHTDSIGGDAYNRSLGQRRARSVRDILVSAGVDPARIDLRTAGAAQAIAPNDTAEGRARNRRVEIRMKAE